MAAASPVRTASARLLSKINTEASAAALEHGLRSRHQPIREACMLALGGKKAA
jgi:HEAT repeat protein